MFCQPEILLDRKPARPKISVLLIDWGVRESFHSLEYLNRQTAERQDYELIWLEFYDRKPDRLQRLLAGNPQLLDQWLVLGYPDDCIFHKHRLYNAGLLAARGEVCVICDSDAIFSPTFIENLTRAFEQTPRGIIHLDEVRNDERRFYPFNYPTIAEILGSGGSNWLGQTTLGLDGSADMIHRANYGACLAARRKDLLAIGGADEHLDYLGYVCGPYELTFRLVNYHGRQERWLRNEYLYHTWHPNTSGINSDYHGPHDGRFMSLRALDARSSFRIKPYRGNPLLKANWRGQPASLESFFEYMKDTPEPTWLSAARPTGPPDDVYWAERNFRGYNLFCHRGRWYALPERDGLFQPPMARAGGYRSLLQAETARDLEALIGPGIGQGGLVQRFRRRFFGQPLQNLPVRAWRKTRRLLSSIPKNKAPWA